MPLGERDNILIGCPWFHAVKPEIDLDRWKITIPRTPRSIKLEHFVNRRREENGVRPLRFTYPKPQIIEEIVEDDSPMNTTSSDSDAVLEKMDRRKRPKRKKKSKIPALNTDPDIDDPDDFDTSEDVWVGATQFAAEVEDPAIFPLSDDEVLIEYASDGSTVRLIENLSFHNRPLTRDGTSAAEIRRAARDSPFRNTWCLAASHDELTKTSNKAQEFALAGEQAKKKKTFEELVPEFLHEYREVFADDGLSKLPPSRPDIDHRIETKPGFIPKTSKVYPLSPNEKEAVRAFLDEHLKKDFIEPSKSPQSSGFFFVGKKDGSLRPCQDYRYINEWTVKNSYPLPLIPELIVRLRDAKYFTKVDVRSGYNNILIHPDDRWKAAFTTQWGLFQPKVMFFGLCNSPATFQDYMNRTFAAEINEGWVVIYMDDILIFSDNLEEHRDRTRRILEILRKEKLFLKPSKCIFDAEEVEFLGMIIRPGHVAMDPAKLKGITEWEPPKTVKEVRSFLGFCNFYRHFISRYSDIARPLIDLTKKLVKFEWTNACREAFQKLKECFTSEPVLRNPDPTRPFAIATDASLVATGAVLLQTDENGAYHPCGYLSQSFNPAE